MSQTTKKASEDLGDVTITVTVIKKEADEVDTVTSDEPAVVTKIRVNQDFVKGYGSKPFLVNGQQVNSVEIFGPSTLKWSSEYDPDTCLSARSVWIETEAEVLTQ